MPSRDPRLLLEDILAARNKRCEILYGDFYPGEERMICYCYSGLIP